MNKRQDIIPNNLKEYRLKRQLTQKEVATYLGLGCADRICHWEKGKNVPSIINLLKLSSLYRATPMQLYDSLLTKIDEEISDRFIKINNKEFLPEK